MKIKIDLDKVLFGGGSSKKEEPPVVPSPDMILPHPVGGEGAVQNLAKALEDGFNNAPVPTLPGGNTNFPPPQQNFYTPTYRPVSFYPVSHMNQTASCYLSSMTHVVSGGYQLPRRKHEYEDDNFDDRDSYDSVCSSCRWYKKINSEEGQCRKSAPSATGQVRVLAIDWCGDYKPRY